MKRITINPLNAGSINKAIRELRAYQEWLDEKKDIYLARLAEVGRDAAEKAYFGGSVNPNIQKPGEEGLRVSVERRGNGYAVVANGSQVVFMEFGAGVRTEDHGLSGPLGIVIAPGGWSETEGEGTWSEWIAAGKDPERYPYNKTPRAGMYEAYKAIVEAQDRIAKEVFGQT